MIKSLHIVKDVMNDALRNELELLLSKCTERSQAIIKRHYSLRNKRSGLLFDITTLDNNEVDLYLALRPCCELIGLQSVYKLLVPSYRQIINPHFKSEVTLNATMST